MPSFSDKSEVIQRGVRNVQDQYCSVAEVRRIYDKSSSLVVLCSHSACQSLLLPAIKQPNLEVLHASTLLAWLEYKRGHFAPFCKYTNVGCLVHLFLLLHLPLLIQMALRVATNLGLHDERTIRAFHNEHERSMLRSSWACVNQLSQTAQSCKSALLLLLQFSLNMFR